MSKELFAALSIARPTNNWDRSVILSPSAYSELLWWIHHLLPWAHLGRPIFPDVSVVRLCITTDASPVGWGARLADPTTGIIQERAAAFAADLANSPQCVRELSAVLHALHSFIRLIKHRHVLIRTDNLQVVAHIMHLGGKSLQLSRIMRQIWELCISHGLQLTAQHISGHQMVCEGVDDLSRSVDSIDHSDWKLHPILFDQLYRLMGPFTIDRFATPLNVQSFQGRPLPFNSWVWFPGSAGVDATLQDWTSDESGHPHCNYGNPPFAMADRVLRLVLAQQVDATLILPHWPAQPWWSLLRFASYLHWLPWHPDTFLPASTSHRHPIRRASFQALAVTFRRSDLRRGLIGQSFPLHPCGGLAFPPSDLGPSCSPQVATS